LAIILLAKFDLPFAMWAINTDLVFLIINKLNLKKFKKTDQTEYILRRKQELAMEVERRAARVQRLKSSRFRKRRPNKMPPIREANYGKSITTKLRRYGTLSTQVAGPMNTVVGLVASLQGSNDWADFAGSYQFFNINKVKVHIIPTNGTIAFATVAVGLCGMSYTGKDSNAITNMNQISDYENYIVWSVNWSDPNTAQRYFKFRPKPSIQPPQATNDPSEKFGHIKTYSDFTGAMGAAYQTATYIITFDVTFSGQA